MILPAAGSPIQIRLLLCSAKLRNCSSLARIAASVRRCVGDIDCSTDEVDRPPMIERRETGRGDVARDAVVPPDDSVFNSVSTVSGRIDARCQSRPEPAPHRPGGCPPRTRALSTAAVGRLAPTWRGAARPTRARRVYSDPQEYTPRPTSSVAARRRPSFFFSASSIARRSVVSRDTPTTNSIEPSSARTGPQRRSK